MMLLAPKWDGLLGALCCEWCSSAGRLPVKGAAVAHEAGDGSTAEIVLALQQAIVDVLSLHREGLPSAHPALLAAASAVSKPICQAYTKCVLGTALSKGTRSGIPVVHVLHLLNMGGQTAKMVCEQLAAIAERGDTNNVHL